MTSRSTEEFVTAESPPRRREGAKARFVLPNLTYVVSVPVFWLSLMSILVSFVLPPDGRFGEERREVSICSFYNVTGRPCFGCGLTRGVSSISHGHAEDALYYNPFAYLFWGSAVVLAFGVVPPIGRRLRMLARSYRVPFNRTFWVIAASFVIYGIVRIAFPSTYWL